jgi:methyl-accepting chemotaxis protein
MLEYGGEDYLSLEEAVGMRILKKMSIRYKLLLAMLFITIVPLGVTSYFQFSNAEDALYKLTISDLQYITLIKSKELEPYTTTNNPSDMDKTKIRAIVDDVAKSYYQPNGMKGYAFILDQTGIALFHPDPNTEGKSLGDLKFIQEMLAKKDGIIEYEFQGAQKITAFRSLPNGWLIGIGSYRDDLLQPIKRSQLDMLYITVTAAVLAIIFAVISLRQLLTPMNNLVMAMRKAESGDLTREIPVTSSDELGQLSLMYNKMMSVFRNILRDMQMVSEQVASASQELTASATESARASVQISEATSALAAGSEQQKETIRATTGSLHRIGKDIEQIAAFAKAVSDNSETADLHAKEGAKKLEELVNKMDDITKRVNSTEEIVQRLGEQSESIMGIISTIREISGQTNLLALNAAIEAARAGEQGRSFAVVANEVRKLAEESGSAAEKISQLILSVKDDINKAVLSMEETSAAVQQGRGGVSEAGDAFRQILRAVEDVNRQIAQMTQAAATISADTAKIVGSADYIAQLADSIANDTQEVAAASEQHTASSQEMTATAETLADMAARLSDQVKRFTI